MTSLLDTYLHVYLLYCAIVFHPDDRALEKRANLLLGSSRSSFPSGAETMTSHCDHFSTLVQLRTKYVQNSSLLMMMILIAPRGPPSTAPTPQPVGPQLTIENPLCPGARASSQVSRGDLTHPWQRRLDPRPTGVLLYRRPKGDASARRPISRPCTPPRSPLVCPIYPTIYTPVGCAQRASINSNFRNCEERHHRRTKFLRERS